MATPTLSDAALQVDGLQLSVSGRWVRTVRLADEFYVSAPSPTEFVARIKTANVPADLYSFVQDLDEPIPRFQFERSDERMAVLPLTTYDHWFNKQIRAKARNMLRKAERSGVQIRVVEFSDDLIHAIRKIYNETPIRQGKRNWHYGKNFDTLRREHATFLERSDFVGAFNGDELIGFAKVTHSNRSSILMNLGALLEHRDKSIANALVAKVVQLVTERSIELLNFGIWGRRGMNAFKVASAFEVRDIPRYHIALNSRGRLYLALGLHRPLKDRLPEEWIVKAAELRARWFAYRYGAQAQRAVERGAAAVDCPGPAGRPAGTPTHH